VVEAFRDDDHGATLADPDGRCRLIRDIGATFEREAWESAQSIYELSQGFVVRDNRSLLAQLKKMRAYNDPVNKKSFFFLGLMKNTGKWTFADEENVGAPVDYHEVRGHLRIGTVCVDASLANKIKAKRIVDEVEDIEIRGAVHQAISLIARKLSVPPMRLHYLFWNLFRNVCLREKPLCRSCHIECALPDRYQQLIQGGHCPFASRCESADLADRLIEHEFVTDWY
jgi:hypothetical protein